MNDESAISKKATPGVAVAPTVPDQACAGGHALLSRRKGSLIRHLLFAVLAAACATLYWGQLRSLISLAYHSEYYSHTIVVPLLAAYLVFRGRKNIFVEDRMWSIWAMVPVFFGAAGYALQRWGLVSLEQQGRLSLAILSIVLLWMGVFGLCYGRHAFRSALFPLLFLLLMVPPPMAIMDSFMHLVRVGSTDIASAIFGTIGIPVFRNGFYFVLPDLTIEVAKECSGIHSTIALLIISIILGYLALQSMWRRVLLVLFIVPIVSLTNGLRIATLTLLAEYVDKGILNSAFHRRGGILFFLLAFGLIVVVLRIVSESKEGTGNRKAPRTFGKESPVSSN